MRILGIDPGSRITGVGVIQSVDKKTYFIDAQSLKLIGDTMTARLGSLYVQLSRYIQLHKPDVVAIEEVFVNPQNIATSLKLAQARGVALATVLSCSFSDSSSVSPTFPIYEYAARLVKKTIVGIGNADKVQVQHMIKILLKVKEDLPIDACDALAIALCHATFNDTLAGKPLAKAKSKGKSWRDYDDRANQGKVTR